jgi:hypothetical protein
MPTERIDISDALTWKEDLPRPRWDLLTTWVASRIEPDDRPVVWTDLTRQWLEKLAPAMNQGHRLFESENFLLLAPLGETAAADLLRFAERCRRDLLATWPGVTAFAHAGKETVITVRDVETYYTYLSVFYPEGRYGGSGGAHIRDGRPHVVLRGANIDLLASPLAHELTHSALRDRSLPLWVEEGMTQDFERKAAGRQPFLIDAEAARRHKRYWKKNGLDLFWSGKGFHQPDKGQELSYQLADVFHLLLVQDHRPRWFGFDQEPRRRLLAFLREAKETDAGAAAARTQLELDLGGLAARFLGPGRWSPHRGDHAANPDHPLAQRSGPSVGG